MYMIWEIPGAGVFVWRAMLGVYDGAFIDDGAFTHDGAMRRELERHLA